MSACGKSKSSGKENVKPQYPPLPGSKEVQKKKMELDQRRKEQLKKSWQRLRSNPTRYEHYLERKRKLPGRCQKPRAKKKFTEECAAPAVSDDPHESDESNKSGEWGAFKMLARPRFSSKYNQHKELFSDVNVGGPR